MQPTSHEIARIANFTDLAISIGSLTFFLFFWFLHYRIVVRAGFSGWLTLVWMIPVVGWFFKLWLAFTPWPTPQKSRRSAPKPRRKRRKVAA